ncbi:MAG: phosphoglucosamine mutase [Planctomycetota bacterium]|nr:MAG: phosphoglucosamine mutase [Planctomycetota bacterium]
MNRFILLITVPARGHPATDAPSAELPVNDPLIVSVSGLRGIVGGALTPEVAVRYARAFVDGLPPGPVVIGRDGRTHGMMFATAIGDALLADGRDVIDGGVAATPTVGILVRQERAAGGIQISASHNPAPYNGLKLFAAEGRVLPAAAGKPVLERFESVARERLKAREPGRRRTVDGTAAHVDLVVATVDAAAIRRQKLKVWLDSGHGAGSRVGVPLLEALGCEVVVEGGEPDGRFEHPPEPTASNLAGMLPRIRAAGAAVGFFQDPDADRLAIATADGRYIGEEATLALVVENVLSRTTGPVVINCSTSGMTARIAERYGVACQVSAVGEANVVDAMLACRAVIGGEGNGGVIDPRVVLVRDSAVAMAQVLDLICRGDSPTSLEHLARSLPQLVMEKAKVDLDAKTTGPGLVTALARVAAAFPEAVADHLDGLRLDWPGGWLLVRASNTEPIVRIVAEERDAATAQACIDKARRAITA